MNKEIMFTRIAELSKLLIEENEKVAKVDQNLMTWNDKTTLCHRQTMLMDSLSINKYIYKYLYNPNEPDLYDDISKYQKSIKIT